MSLLLRDLPGSNLPPGFALSIENVNKGTKRPLRGYLHFRDGPIPSVSICTSNRLVRNLQYKKHVVEKERKQVQAQQAALALRLTAAHQQPQPFTANVRRQAMTVSVQPTQTQTQTHNEVAQTPSGLTDLATAPGTAGPSPTTLALSLLRKRGPVHRPIGPSAPSAAALTAAANNQLPATPAPVPAVPATPTLSASASRAAALATADQLGASLAATLAQTRHASHTHAPVHSALPVRGHHTQIQVPVQIARPKRPREVIGAPVDDPILEMSASSFLSPRATKRARHSSPDTDLKSPPTVDAPSSAAASVPQFRSPPASAAAAITDRPAFGVRSPHPAPISAPALPTAMNTSIVRIPPSPTPSFTSQSSVPSRAHSTSSAYRSLDAALSQMPSGRVTNSANTNSMPGGFHARFAPSLGGFSTAFMPRTANGQQIALRQANHAQDKFHQDHPNFVASRTPHLLPPPTPNMYVPSTPLTVSAAAAAASDSATNFPRSLGLQRLIKAKEEEKRRKDHQANIAIAAAQREIEAKEAAQAAAAAAGVKPTDDDADGIADGVGVVVGGALSSPPPNPSAAALFTPPRASSLASPSSRAATRVNLKRKTRPESSRHTRIVKEEEIDEIIPSNQLDEHQQPSETNIHVKPTHLDHSDENAPITRSGRKRV